MNELLSAAAAALRAIPGPRDRDVFITPHENYIPSGARQPCIGVKDGRIRRKELGGGMIEEVLQISCVAIVKADGEDGLSGEKGVLQLVKSIEVTLDQNLLGLAGMESAWSPSESAAQLFVTNNKQWLVKKAITFEYERTRQRGV